MFTKIFSCICQNLTFVLDSGKNLLMYLTFLAWCYSFHVLLNKSKILTIEHSVRVCLNVFGVSMQASSGSVLYMISDCAGSKARSVGSKLIWNLVFGELCKGFSLSRSGDPGILLFLIDALELFDDAEAHLRESFSIDYTSYSYSYSYYHSSKSLIRIPGTLFIFDLMPGSF